MKAVDAGAECVLIFAAETENLEANAREKLVRKHCDLIIANDISQPGIGFDSDTNQVLLIYPDRTEALPFASKHELSLQLVDAIIAVKKLMVES